MFDLSADVAALEPFLTSPLFLIAIGVPLAAALLRRVPLVGPLMTVASWLVLIGIVAIALGERERFDPYLAQAAAALGIERQEVVGEELRIRMAPDGHFWARVEVDGVERRMLVDSGATLTALSSGTARAAGLEVSEGPFPMLIRTANGTVRAGRATVEDLRVGPIAARDLPVVVSPAFGEVSVLGMNFLSRLKSWRVEGETLILVPHGATA